MVNRVLAVRDEIKPEKLASYQRKLNDIKDVHFLAAFEKFESDILVTGDQELLKKVKGAYTTRQAIERILTNRA